MSYVYLGAPFLNMFHEFYSNYSGLFFVQNIYARLQNTKYSCNYLGTNCPIYELLSEAFYVATVLLYIYFTHNNASLFHGVCLAMELNYITIVMALFKSGEPLRVHARKHKSHLNAC